MARHAAPSFRVFALLGAAVFAGGCRDSSAGSRSEASGAPAAEAPADVSLPGIDTSAMTPRERRQWSGLVGELLAPCPSVPVSVSQCVREARACPTCVLAAKWVAHAVRDGSSEEQIRHAYRQRFDPSAVRTLPFDGSPSRGPEEAPVVIFEFADFECPHCRMAVPMLDAVLAAHPDKVRLVYKAFTLSFHQRGEPAARAAFAAGAQGKFWEMEHLLFERQEHLEPADLERYAVVLKLDMGKFKADFESQAIKDRVARDHALGEQLKLQGTPAIFVNGRELDLEHDESLEGRVATELGLTPSPTVEATKASTEAASGSPK